MSSARRDDEQWRAPREEEQRSRRRKRPANYRRNLRDTTLARFRGIDKTQFLDNRQFNGNAFTLLANAERFLRDSLPIAARFEEGRFDRIDEPLIEEWGGGTLKMAELASAAGLPMPEIEDDGWCVTVRFQHGRFVPERRRGGTNPEERQEEILALLERAQDGLTRAEIRARYSPTVSERQVRRALEGLRNRGLVVSTNRGPLTRWRRAGGVMGHDGAR